MSTVSSWRSVRRPEASVTLSRSASAGRVYLKGVCGSIGLAVFVFLDESSTGCQSVSVSCYEHLLIDIPGMGSAATAVNSAAIGKKQVTFILSK
jgi:hypothetical protein